MPKFSGKQSKQLVNSFDFLGVNYYVTMNVENRPNCVPADQRDFIGDMTAYVEGNLFLLKLLTISMFKNVIKKHVACWSKLSYLDFFKLPMVAWFFFFVF